MHLRLLVLFILIDAASAECHRSWLHYNNSCYYFGKQPLNWFSAASSCREHGANLAEIETSGEALFLKDVAQRLKNYFWVGARDDEVEGVWEWSSGVPFEYKDWAPGEPNELQIKSNEDCLFVAAAGWYDYNCSGAVLYICEKRYPDDGSTIIG